MLVTKLAGPLPGLRELAMNKTCGYGKVAPGFIKNIFGANASYDSESLDWLDSVWAKELNLEGKDGWNEAVEWLRPRASSSVKPGPAEGRFCSDMKMRIPNLRNRIYIGRRFGGGNSTAAGGKNQRAAALFR